MYDNFASSTVMSYQDSPFSTMYDRQDDYDLDEDNEDYIEDDMDVDDQDESDEGKRSCYDNKQICQCFYFCIYIASYLYCIVFVMSFMLIS